MTRVYSSDRDYPKRPIEYPQDTKWAYRRDDKGLSYDKAKHRRTFS